MHKKNGVKSVRDKKAQYSNLSKKRGARIDNQNHTPLHKKRAKMGVSCQRLVRQKKRTSFCIKLFYFPQSCTLHWAKPYTTLQWQVPAMHTKVERGGPVMIVVFANYAILLILAKCKGFMSIGKEKLNRYSFFSENDQKHNLEVNKDSKNLIG